MFGILLTPNNSYICVQDLTKTMIDKIVIISQNSVLNVCIREDAWNDAELYKEEYQQIIKFRENDRIVYHQQSPQIIFRDYIIKYLKNICTKFGLTLCTLHLSVYLLDIFMDNHKIIADKLLIVANVCLKIAAKIEEIEDNIPTFLDLNNETDIIFSAQNYKSTEILILNFFNWFVMFPTAAHYTHYYLQYVITTTDIRISGKTARILIFNIMNTINEFLDKIIDNVHYMQLCKPSKLASAIISIARDKLNLPAWTEQLRQITSYPEDDFESIKNALLE